jgi:hypothetical protein
MTDLIKLGNELINYYVVKYQEVYGSRPIINRNTAKWAARDLVESFGIDECQKCIDWYFYVKDTGHNWNWLASNMESLYNARKTKERDDKERKVNRMRARAWLNG